MQQESDRVDEDTNDRRHHDVTRNGHHAQGTIEHSIRPGVPCPETVLVAAMTDGSCLLLAYPQGEPAAFAVGKDADPLRWELAAAFGSADLAPTNHQSEAL